MRKDLVCGGDLGSDLEDQLHARLEMSVSETSEGAIEFFSLS